MFVRVFQSIFVLLVNTLNAFLGLIIGSEHFVFEIAALGYYAVLICS
jgi:hypothetical protein